MAVYKITFTPSAPYFFGNEKNFRFNGSQFANSYYIKGETMPSQSTLLGALRYLLLPVKGFDRLDSEEAIAAIGPESFSMDKAQQNFGKLKAMSCVFLSRSGEHFIPTPMDHNCAVADHYAPFTEYVMMEEPQKLYTPQYDAKLGTASSFLSLDDCHLEHDLFRAEVRIGINRRAENDGFFKKEYQCLKQGFSFAVYAEIDEKMAKTPYVVLLGQGKVPFTVRFAETEEPDVFAINRQAQAVLARYGNGRKTIYCLSDLLVGEGALYENMLFAIVQTRDYRSYRTQPGGKIGKGEVLHRLVKAGSIFLPDENCVRTFAETPQQRNAATVGYNQIVMTGGTANA